MDDQHQTAPESTRGLFDPPEKVRLRKTPPPSLTQLVYYHLFPTLLPQPTQPRSSLMNSVLNDGLFLLGIHCS
jgi:protein SSD1